MVEPIPKQRILILCTGNSCRSQMAAGWINALMAESCEAFSAGSQPAAQVHPLAIRVMAEAGIDLSGKVPRSMLEFIDQPFDIVATVCDEANKVCPVFPGAGRRIHRAFRDPAQAQGSEEERVQIFRQVRDEICNWVKLTF